METLFVLRDDFMNSIVKNIASLQLETFLTRNSKSNESIDLIKSNKEHTFKDILEIVKINIKKERLYDITNPFVILCSEELTNLLGVRAIHISQICSAIKKKMGLNKEALLDPFNNVPKAAHGEMSFYYLQAKDGDAWTKKSMSDPSSPLCTEFHQWLETYKESTNESAKFRLCPELRQLFEKVAPIQQLEILSANQVSKCLTRYLMLNKDKFSLPNNPELLMLGNDALAKILGQRTVFFPQMKRLLIKNLILVKNEDSSGSNCNEGCGEEASTSQVETDSGAPPPRLTTSVSMPARPRPSKVTANNIVELLEAQGYARKRSNSDEQGDQRSEKSLKIDPTDPVAILSSCAAILQRSLTVTGYPTPPSASCPALTSTQRESREVRGDYSSSDTEDNELSEMKEEDIRKEDSFNCDTRPGTPDTIIDETEHLSTSSQKLEDFSSSSQKLETKPINKYDSGFCSTRLSDFTGGNAASSTFDGSAPSSDDIKKEMIKTEDDLESDEGEDEIDGFVVVHNKDVESEEKLDVSNDIETDDIKEEDWIRQPVRQISKHVCLRCRVSERDASFVHGKSAHQICCYPCSKEMLRKHKKLCPVCKVPVEKVVRNIVI